MALSNGREQASLVRLVAVSALLLVCLLTTVGGHAAQPSSLDGKALVEALRAGGYNIYFRHVATNWSQSDDVRDRDDWLDCDPARMRQLSDAGRADAIAIGNLPCVAVLLQEQWIPSIDSLQCRQRNIAGTQAPRKAKVDLI